VSRITLQPKLAGEIAFPSQPFDFISRLAVGETISSQQVSASVYSGTDPNPSSLINGAASVQNSTQVWQLLAGGLVGCIYELLCTITTSLGQTLQISAYLAVVSDLP